MIAMFVLLKARSSAIASFVSSIISGWSIFDSVLSNIWSCLTSSMCYDFPIVFINSTWITISLIELNYFNKISIAILNVGKVACFFILPSASSFSMRVALWLSRMSLRLNTFIYFSYPIFCLTTGSLLPKYKPDPSIGTSI